MKSQPQIFVRMERCVGCHNCELACAVAHSNSQTLAGAVNEPATPQRRIFVEAAEGCKFPVVCSHCEDAPCARVCPSGALFADFESGLIRYAEQKCIGCSLCTAACPFGVIRENRHHFTVVKCDRCADRNVPACVAACPTHALMLQPDYDDARQREAVARLAAATAMGLKRGRA